MNVKICKKLRKAARYHPGATIYEPALYRPRGVERHTLEGIKMEVMNWPQPVHITKGSPRHVYKAMKRLQRQGCLNMRDFLTSAVT